MLLKFEEGLDGSKIEGELELSPGKRRFNPMESWMQAGEILDSTMLYGTPEDYGVTQEVTDRSGVPSIPYQGMDYGTSTDYGVSNPPPMQQMSHMPNQMGPDPASLAMPNMPYDFTGGLPNAFEGDPPPPTAYGSPNAGGGIQEPLATSPPPGYPSNVPTADAYSTPPTPPNTGVPGFEPMPTAAEGQDAQVSAVEKDWNATMDQAQVPAGTKEQAAATIATSAAQNDGTSTVGGEDAGTDPAMVRQWGELAYDPTKRKEEYTKKMNTIFMQSMLLDIAANAMGVKSRAGAFMEHQMKVLEGEMKFDDQERLYRITQGVFYPNGVYDPPSSQREAFDRAMALGATAEEAAAITGYMPKDQSGFDTYYKAGADGQIETIHVPKGQAPPAGVTDAPGVATHNADLNNPAAGSAPTAMEIEAQVNAWTVEANELEAAGDTAGANALRLRAEQLLKLGGGESVSDPYTPSVANTSFNGMYGSMIRSAGEYGQDKTNTYRDKDANFIPWPVFKKNWLESYQMEVMGPDGTVITVPGWLSEKGDPNAAVTQNTAIPTIASDAQFDALDIGDKFYDSTGQLYIKVQGGGSALVKEAE